MRVQISFPPASIPTPPSLDNLNRTHGPFLFIFLNDLEGCFIALSLGVEEVSPLLYGSLHFLVEARRLSP